MSHEQESDSSSQELSSIASQDAIQTEILYDDAELAAAQTDIENFAFARTVSSSKIDAGPPYSILKHYEKLIISVNLSMIGIWSAIAAPIYYPALPILEVYFDKSEGVMNLSIVAYLVFQGLAPSFTSNIADYLGRRPTILVSMICFVGVCIGISQANAFWLLVFLRCLQASTIAPVIAINSGVVGDITQRHERGSYIGAVSGVTLVGQGFGSLLGAALTASFNWRAIFYFLAIGGFSCFLITFCILPETKRSMVGNLSIRPKSIANIAPILLLPRYKERLTNDLDSLPEGSDHKQSFDIFGPLKILMKRDIFFTLVPAAVQYTAWTMTLTSTSLNLAKYYGYSVMHVGWCFLAPGIACLIGSVTAGRVLDWYYRRNKKQYDDKYAGVPKKQRPAFNLYHARLGVCYIPSVIMAGGLIMFGWCLDKQVHIAAVLIGTILVSYFTMYSMTAVSTIIVDMYPDSAASGTACVNLTRCLCGALGVGVLSKMTETLTVGGCYTFWAAIVILSNIPVLYVASQFTKKIEREERESSTEASETKEHK